MAENRLWPAYGVIAYHSADGTHNATVPTLEWFPTPLVPGNHLGSYLNHAAITCDGEAMWGELLSNLKAFNPATTVFDSVTIYTLETPESPAIPRATHVFNIAGTNATGGWSKAAQRCWIFRDTEWQVLKLYQLDTATDDSWDAVAGDGGIAAAAAVAGTITSSSWAFASRNGERPQTLMRITVKLNDKLRQEYGMA
jgi:hypothetical protein